MTTNPVKYDITTPSYLATGAIAYSAIVSGSMRVIGRPLTHSVAEKAEAKSQFLFELTREVDGSLLGLGNDHASQIPGPLTSAFASEVTQWVNVIRKHCHLTWLAKSSSVFSPALLLLPKALKYSIDQLSLGVAAFTAVLSALNPLTHKCLRIAEWPASARRADELRQALSPRSGTA